MSSVFTTSNDSKIKSSFGKGKFIPFYLQFVPGVCIETITNENSMKSYHDENNVNTILAIPHIRGGAPKKKKTNLNDNDRYLPLLRGIFEVPAKGDPVLLCTIGGVNYYLGPLNTQNNVNFNADNMWEPEVLESNKEGVETHERLEKGESLNFEKVNHNRMSKIYNSVLDGKLAVNENHGDIMLEGRHGNSFRVGSRGKTPYMYISNGRGTSFKKEGFADGTLISITNRGSLNQHFGGYAKQLAPFSDVGNPESLQLEIVDGFRLASDYINVAKKEEPPKRLMGDLIKSVNGVDDVKSLIYDYGKDEEQNQILATSDRITINSKSDDIYLSSHKDIHLGSRENLTISTGEDFIVESERTYLGSPIIDGTSTDVDNMVLGKKLQSVLNSILDIFTKFEVMTMMGNQRALPTIQPTLDSVSTEIDGILSTKHFIDK